MPALALLLALAYSAWIYVIRTREIRPASPPAPYGSDAFDRDAVDRLFSSRGQGDLTDEQVDVFLRAVLFPKTVFSRISESAALQTRSLKITGSLVVTLRSDLANADGPGLLVLPIYLPRKPLRRNLLVDGLRVSIAGERRSTAIKRRCSPQRWSER